MAIPGGDRKAASCSRAVRTQATYVVGAGDAGRARRAGRVRAGADPRPHKRRAGTGEGEWEELGAAVQADRAPEARVDQAPRSGRRNPCRDRLQLQRRPGDDFETWPENVTTLERRSEQDVLLTDTYHPCHLPTRRMDSRAANGDCRR